MTPKSFLKYFYPKNPKNQYLSIISQKLTMASDEVMMHEPDLNAKPERPALKTENSKKKKKVISLTWDEHAIEEHDQLRGTRMKVSLVGH